MAVDVAMDACCDNLFFVVFIVVVSVVIVVDHDELAAAVHLAVEVLHGGLSLGGWNEVILVETGILRTQRGRKKEEDKLENK